MDKSDKTEDKIDKKALETVSGQRVFVSMNTCMICKKTGSDISDNPCVRRPSAGPEGTWGQDVSIYDTICYLQSPNPPHTIVVHCKTSQCQKGAEFVVRNDLAENKQFFISQSSYKKLFQNDTEFQILRSNGSTDTGTLVSASFSNVPALLSRSRGCVGFWVEWYNNTQSERTTKVVTLEELFKVNPLFVQRLKEQGGIDLQLEYEDEFKEEFPELYQKIQQSIIHLNRSFFSQRHRKMMIA